MPGPDAIAESCSGDAPPLDGAEVFFTPANVWEIEIKVSIGKLERPSADVVQAARSSFAELPIPSPHAATAGQLPMHHRDPFDRMIIAQGQEEGLTVVTPDDKFSLYDVDVMVC